MSVGWKTLTRDATCPCGRMHGHSGCGMEHRGTDNRKKKEKPADFKFWSHDHFGLMPGILDVK